MVITSFIRKQAPESANQNPSQGEPETRIKEGRVLVCTCIRGMALLDSSLWVGGWVVFDRPSKEKRPFFFSPSEGIRYLFSTDRNSAVIKDRGNPSAIQLFPISLASIVRMLVTASICFVEIRWCARVCGHKLLPAALAFMPFGYVLERRCFYNVVPLSFLATAKGYFPQYHLNLVLIGIRPRLSKVSSLV